MATNSNIEWTDATWNPLAGCTPASEGCRNCYAAALAYRLERMGQTKYAGTARKTRSDGRAVFTGKINLDEVALQTPFTWKKPRRVFVNSMSDLFHEAVPFDFVDRVFQTMIDTPQHTYQVLTKRPTRMAEYTTTRALRLSGKLPANIWCGTSVEDQRAANARIPHLLKVPATIRFLSCEPLLERIDISRLLVSTPCWHCGNLDGEAGRCYCGVYTPSEIHWVIVGGESGPRHRPFDPAWAGALRAQCWDAGIAFFMKQMGGPANAKGGELEDLPIDLRVREMPA